MRRRVLTTLLSAVFILSMLISPFSNNSPRQAHASAAMKVGDYVQFGQYLGSPILWRVINIESDGSPMLFSEKILSFKPFDASESGTYKKAGNNPYSTDANRQMLGSNRWENSNLREWLNSSDLKVKYTTQAPTREALGGNAYADEPGFLSNFSEDERNAIKPVDHKSILAVIDSKYKNGGTEVHPYNENTDYSLQNYDRAYFENVTDMVYLIDIKEFHSYVYGRGFNYIKKPTVEAVNASSYKDPLLNSNNYWQYWLRLPTADFPSYVRQVGSDHFIYSSSANHPGVGVAPTLNLKSNITKSGSGTATDPYIPANTTPVDKLYSIAVSLTNAALSSKTQKSINDARFAVLALKTTAKASDVEGLLKKLDAVQKPLIDKTLSTINKAQSSLKQTDLNSARASIDSELPASWENYFIALLDLAQKKLIKNAEEAVKKASKTKLQEDYASAITLLSDIAVSTDSSITAWADSMKKDLRTNVFVNKQTPPENTMQIGDYVQFGKYLGKPILWRVINVDSEGSPMLFSEKILSLKPYDASESGRDGSFGKNPYTTDSNRQAYGSNRWENSNIREWLNSSDAAVKYSTQAPTKASVYQNSYDKEPGFLSNFSQPERNLLNPITHKVILTSSDSSLRTAGTEKDHIYNENIGNWLQNYDYVYYKNVTDSVYLLDIKELYDYVYRRGFEYVKKPTQEAVNSSQNKYTVLSPSANWFYWLRVPVTDDSIGVRHMGSSGLLFSSNASWYSTGVVPALNLKYGLAMSGKGTIDNPYIPDNGTFAEKLYSNAFSALQNAKSLKTQKSINVARAAGTALSGTSRSASAGELSKQLDLLQQPILVQIQNAINKAQSSLKQKDIDTARALIDPELPLELKDSYLTTVNGLQDKLKGRAVAAHNKAVQTMLLTDINAANALIADIETSTDALVSSWVKAVKSQTGIVEEVVTLKDKNLEEAIRTSLKKPTGDLYKTDLQKITKLIAPGKSIFDLSGIEYLINLQQLDLGNDLVQKTTNYISDITPLKALTNLAYLRLSSNNISDLSPIKGLTNLNSLDLNSNLISDMSAVRGLTKLNQLLLSFNSIKDISAVKDLTNLTWFYVEANQISDITPLKGLTKFTNLNLYNNQIRDSEIVSLKRALPDCKFYRQ